MANPGMQKYRVLTHPQFELIPLDPPTAPQLRPAPFDALPNELIIKIIQAGANNSDPDDAGNFAILASHVCRRWRVAILTTSMFWTTIRISGWNWRSKGPFIEARDLERELLRASTFLKRSPSSCPIRMFILARPLEGQGGAQIVASSIATVITPHIQRVAQFRLEYEGFESGDVAIIAPSGPMPLLKRWSILRVPWIGCNAGDMARAHDQIVLPNFQPLGDKSQVEMFPNLERMSLSFTGLVWTRITTRNLRVLELFNLSAATRPTWHELRGVLLANAHTLTSLVLDGGCPLSLDICEPFRMPALLSLRFTYVNPLCLEQFTTICQVPRLRKLLIFYRGDTENSSQDFDLRQALALASIMQHIPLEQILYLRFSHVPIPHTAHTFLTTTTNLPLQYALFRRLSSLKTLKLTAADAPTLQALNAPTPRLTTEVPPLHLPQLSHLYLNEIDAITIIDFLEERMQKLKDGNIALLSELNFYVMESVWRSAYASGLPAVAQIISNTTASTQSVVIF